MSLTGPYAAADRALAAIEHVTVEARIAIARRARRCGAESAGPEATGPPKGFELVAVPERPSLRPAARTPGDCNMSDRALALIEKLARDAPLCRFLEVGVFKGVTTSVLAQIGPTVAVDWFQGNPEAVRRPRLQNALDFVDRREGFLEALDAIGIRDRVTLVEGNSHHILPSLRGNRFGLAIVDADHSEAAAYADIRDVWPLVVPGGILVLDDYSVTEVGGRLVPDVRLAWERFARDRGVQGLPLLTADDEARPKTVAVVRP